MKILYHHRIKSKDGQYVHLSAMVASLRQRGHRVLVVGPNLGDSKKIGGESFFVNGIKRLLSGRVYEWLEFGYNCWDFVRLLANILYFRPDVIYERYNLFFISGVVAHKLTGIPLLMEINAPLVDERRKNGDLISLRLARWCERYAWKNCDVTLPVTQVLKEIVYAEIGSSNCSVVIPNGIHLQEFYNIGNEKNGGESRKSLTIGFIGFLREWHGLERLIDFAADGTQLSHNVLIVGDGPARLALQSQAKKLGVADRVKFTGVIQRDDIPTHLAQMDIAVQSGVVDYASPLKLIEYLAAGLAIIAPDKPNIRELLVHGQNALLFDSASETSFDETLQQLCSDSNLRERLSVAAKRTILEHRLTWGENAEKVEELARSLVSDEP